jgi:hypothetical protein
LVDAVAGATQDRKFIRGDDKEDIMATGAILNNGRKAIKSAIAALPAPAGESVTGWQPIETAPKDGTEIWAFNGEQARMKWFDADDQDEGYSLWIWADELSCDVDPSPEQPTHWQPLPAAPRKSEARS